VHANALLCAARLAKRLIAGRGRARHPTSFPDEGDSTDMKIVIDADKCEGHSRCYSLAPDLVDVDDLGNALVLGDGTVTEGLEDKARLIVDNCPEYAISIEED